ncbi:MAG: hypothetical protein VYE68_11920, partial [Acidobacteriota bacterium]|nr:hypothetical protein [Acidobacteriota bacterium]
STHRITKIHRDHDARSRSARNHPQPSSEGTASRARNGYDESARPLVNATPGIQVPFARTTRARADQLGIPGQRRQ